MKPYRGKVLCHSVWQVDWPAVPQVDREVFKSMERLLQEPMQQVTLDARSGVSRLSRQSTYYVKSFKGRGTGIKHWLGISRYRRELRNLQYFARLGLATPQLIAYGHESSLGLVGRAVIATAEVEIARDLEKIIEAEELYTEGLSGARQVLGKLAEAAQLLHAQGFYHKDLKTRNILVRRDGLEPELFFFDCPSGHHPPRFMLRRGIVRDLAHLQEGLRASVRRVDILYMYKKYRGCDKLSEEDKALARDVLSYYAQRRMTRKRRLREARRMAG